MTKRKGQSAETMRKAREKMVDNIKEEAWREMAGSVTFQVKSCNPYENWLYKGDAYEAVNGFMESKGIEPKGEI